MSEGTRTLAGLIAGTLCYGFVLVGYYLCAAFILAEPNPFQWGAGVRGLLVAIIVFTIPFPAMIIETNNVRENLRDLFLELSEK